MGTGIGTAAVLGLATRIGTEEVPVVGFVTGIGIEASGLLTGTSTEFLFVFVSGTTAPGLLSAVFLPQSFDFFFYLRRRSFRETFTAKALRLSATCISVNTEGTGVSPPTPKELTV